MKETYQNIKYKVNIPLIIRILRYIFCWIGEQSEFVSNFTRDFVTIRYNQVCMKTMS